MLQSEVDVLKAVRDLNKPSVTDIVEETEYSRSTVNDNLESLNQSSLISVTETSNPTKPDIREPTKSGLERIIDEKHGSLDLRKPNTSGEHEGGDGDPYFTHFFALICRWDDPDMLGEDWRERLMELESLDDVEVSEQKDFGRVQLVSENWVFKFTGRSLEIQLRSEISGEDFRTIAWRAWRRSLKGLNFLEEKTGESIPSERFEIRVKSHHVGSRGKDIAKTFIDHIDENTEQSPRSFEVLDDSEEIRIYADKSGPGGMWERESGNGGQKDGRMDTALDDSQLLQEFTWKGISNPGDFLRLIDQPGRVDDLESKVDDAVDSLSSIESDRSEEKRTREALIELVRSNKQEREEMQERFEERMDRMQESFQTQLERQQSIIEGLKDEVEELREEEKSLEERVKEKFRDHPDFSSVWEHSQNHSLYVWDQRNGKQECKKVLDESMRDLQKIEVEAAHG